MLLSPRFTPEMNWEMALWENCPLVMATLSLDDDGAVSLGCYSGGEDKASDILVCLFY